MPSSHFQQHLVTLAHLADLRLLSCYLCDLSYICDLLPHAAPQYWIGTSALTPHQSLGRASQDLVIFKFRLGC